MWFSSTLLVNIIALYLFFSFLFAVLSLKYVMYNRQRLFVFRLPFFRLFLFSVYFFLLFVRSVFFLCSSYRWESIQSECNLVGRFRFRICIFFGLCETLLLLLLLLLFVLCINMEDSPNDDSLSIDESRWLLLLLWWVLLLLFVLAVSCDVKFEWWDRWLTVEGKAYIFKPKERIVKRSYEEYRSDYQEQKEMALSI